MDYRLLFAVLLWGLLFGMALWRATRSDELSSRQERWILAAFLAVLAVALPVWRLRSLLYPGEINVDESQILAQALRYRLDPVPWRSVDGGSGGPLYTWALFWAPLVGVKLDYFAARVTSLGCFWLLLSGLTLSLRELAKARFGLLLAFPAVTLVLTSLNFDYVFFSSEQLPNALLAWSIYLLLRQLKKPSAPGWYAIGLLTGAVPFCKVQAGPAAVFVWGTAAALACYRHQDRRLAWKRCGWLALGGASVPACILIPVFVAGAWSEFWNGYILSALIYSSSGQVQATLSERLAGFRSLLFGVWEFREFVLATLTLGVLLLFRIAPRCGKISAARALGMGAVAGLALVLGYAVYRPGFLFPHYTLFLILPVSLCAGALFLVRDPAGPQPAWPRASVALLMVLPALIQGASTIHHFVQNKRLLADWGPGVHPIGEFLQKLVKPGDTMLVWGYAPKFHVFSQIPPASRHLATVHLLLTDPLSSPVAARLHRTFLEDLNRARPALIVDAPDEFHFPDPAYPRGVMARHTLHKPTADFVRQNYELIQQIQSGPQQVPIFVYKRKESAP
ncbi:MAG: hypothetical protein RLZZ399_2384 [Verrucomicrobiota bacterium]